MYCYIATSLSDFNSMNSQCLTACENAGILPSGVFESYSTDRFHDGRTNSYAIPIKDEFRTAIENSMNAEQLAKCVTISYTTHPDLFPNTTANRTSDTNKDYTDGCATVTGNDYTGSWNGSSNDTKMPYAYYWKYSVSCQIMTAAELGSAKQITGIETQIAYQGSSGHFDRDHFIYLMHTTDSSLINASDVNLTGVNVSDRTLVWSGDVYTPPSSSGQWTGDVYSYQGPLVLDTNFCYNGTDNLIILWEKRWGSYTSGGPQFETNSSAGISSGSFADYDVTVI